MRLLRLLKKAREITGAEAILTTSFEEFLRSMNLSRRDILLLWMFYFSPRVSPEGMIYFPKAFLILPERWKLKILIHECNHIQHPQADEAEIRWITKAQMEVNFNG